MIIFNNILILSKMINFVLYLIDLNLILIILEKLINKYNISDTK